MKLVVANITFLILFTGFNLAFAQAPAKRPMQKAHSATEQQAPDPRSTVRQGVKRIQDFLATDAYIHPAKVSAFLDKEIAPMFDFDAMSQMSLGSLNYQLNAQQRKGVTRMVRKAFLKALASNLANYRGGHIGKLRVTGNSARGRLKVSLVIFRPDQYPTSLQLRLALSPKGWRAIDVSANGISAVAHYRNYIRSVVQRSGLDGLLQ